LPTRITIFIGMRTVAQGAYAPKGAGASGMPLLHPQVHPPAFTELVPATLLQINNYPIFPKGALRPFACVCPEGCRGERKAPAAPAGTSPCLHRASACNPVANKQLSYIPKGSFAPLYVRMPRRVQGRAESPCCARRHIPYLVHMPTNTKKKPLPFRKEPKNAGAHGRHCPFPLMG
jgi:hypothetical protein